MMPSLVRECLSAYVKGEDPASIADSIGIGLGEVHRELRRAVAAHLTTDAAVVVFPGWASLTRQQLDLCHALIRARGQVVRFNGLEMLVGGINPANTLKTQGCRIRQRIVAIGLPDPIANVWGVGYRWVGPLPGGSAAP